MNVDARRETFYAQLVVLLLNQGRYKEAAGLMERHEARREWEAGQPFFSEPPASDPRPDPRTHPAMKRFSHAAGICDCCDAPDECPLGHLDLEAGGCTCVNECALGYPENPESK